MVEDVNLNSLNDMIHSWYFNFKYVKLSHVYLDYEHFDRLFLNYWSLKR